MSRRIAPRSAIASIAPNCAGPGGARAGISCAPISPTMIRRGYGACTCSSSASKRRSRTSRGDLAVRPIFPQDQGRVEAHLFIAFLAYCLHVTLGRRLHALAPGLTPRSAIEKFAAVQMIDLHIPTTDGRELLLTRYTEPEPELALLLDKLKFVLPAQPEPKISAAQTAPPSPV